MSSMAFSMYLFTRGEGTLRTTQDLFTQAYYFVEEGTRLSAIIFEFANQVRRKIFIESKFSFHLDSKQSQSTRYSQST